MIAYNDSNHVQTFQVAWGIESFTYTLPALSGATFSWNSQQVGGYTVDAHSQIQASSFNTASHVETESTQDDQGGWDLGNANDGGYAVYKNIDFGSGVTGLSARVASAASGTTLEFRLDQLDGVPLASVSTPNTGGWQQWTTISSSVSNVQGVHTIYAIFHGAQNLNWFQFS